MGDVTITGFCGYDQLGNKNLGVDGIGNAQTWNYSTRTMSSPDDEHCRRAIQRSGRAHDPVRYNDFGSWRTKTRPTVFSRTYSYLQNGWLSLVTEHEQG